MKMNKEMKQSWLDALRSGDYKKGEGHLYATDTDCYCVFGVLLKATGWELSDVDINEYKRENDFFWDDYSFKELMQPNMEERWNNADGEVNLGEDEPDGYNLKNVLKIDREHAVNIMQMNDGIGIYKDVGPLTFTEIADWIEKEL